MDGIARSEDEFHETLEDITSASSSDAEEGGRRGMRARVAPVTSHERPPIWTASSFHSKFSVWKDDPSTVNDRRQRFFRNWGIKNLREEPSVGPATSLASKTLLAAANVETSNGVANEMMCCQTCEQHRRSNGVTTCTCKHLLDLQGNLTAELEKKADSCNTVENGCKAVTDFGQLERTCSNRLEETSGAVLREGKSKSGPVLGSLGLVTTHGRFRNSVSSTDVSSYQEMTSKVLASPEGSLSPLWTPEAGYLHQASSSQEKLSQSFDTDNGYETRSQDGYSAAEDFVMDDEVLKIRDLDSGKEFLMNRFNTDGSLNMLREVDTGRELTLAEFERVVGLSPITQEMKRRQRAAESGLSNTRSGLGKTSSTKKNAWLKYFVVKKPKEKPITGGSARSDKPLQSGEDTDGSSKRGRLSRDGSTKGGNSREGSFAGPDRENSTKGGSPADDTTPGRSSRQSKKVKVKIRRKSMKELSDLHVGQEIQAHQGAIWTMKFSPDGRYLASAGQDRVVRVWEVLDHPSFSDLDFSGGQENGNSANGLHLQGDGGSAKDGNARVSQQGIFKLDKEGSIKDSMDGSTEVEKVGSTRGTKERSTRGAKEGIARNGKLSQSRKSSRRGSKGPLPKLFWLSEKPVHSFYGHTGDVLDLSWSQTKSSISDKLLLSSSMDKTVRLWHISEEECLRVFSHKDYVTCIQFNPVDDSYFLSGALDDKLRIWNIAEHQVVDYIYLREMVSAVSYTPDGEKAIVGSYKGTCRFYNTTGNKLQLDASIDVRTDNKKGKGKKITGLHCMPGDQQKVLVTSNDSRIRVYDGLELCAKYKGLKNINSQISASYTRNGDYIISASEDSRVLVWSADNKDPSSTKSLYRRDKQLACEEFHCRFVSVAVPWPEPTTDSSILQPDSGAATGSDRMDSAHAASEPDDLGALLTDDDDDDIFEPSYDYLSSGRRDQVVEVEEEALPENVSSDVLNSGDAMDSSPRLQSCTSFFTDSGPKGSSTWPEEQLPAFGSPLAGLMRSASLGSDDGRHGAVVEEASSSLVKSDTLSVHSPLWGLVIVTAGLDGEIRTFQNYGHPVRI